MTAIDGLLWTQQHFLRCRHVLRYKQATILYLMACLGSISIKYLHLWSINIFRNDHHRKRYRKRTKKNESSWTCFEQLPTLSVPYDQLFQEEGKQRPSFRYIECWHVYDQRLQDFFLCPWERERWLSDFWGVTLFWQCLRGSLALTMAHEVLRVFYVFKGKRRVTCFTAVYFFFFISLCVFLQLFTFIYGSVCMFVSVA